MVKHIWMYFLMAACSLSAQTVDVVDYIRPIVGASTSTDAAKSGHGLGKTFPGSATPFGLVQLSPDTETSGDNGPGYSWHHKTIEGFSFIHMSGIGWYGDFGNFLVTPSTGTLHVWKGRSDNPEQGYCSRYSHDTEVAEAGYYAVNLDDYDVRVELSSMPRAGIMRMTYPKSDTSRIQIDLARRIGGTSSEQYIRKVDDHTLAGWMKCTPDGGGWGHGAGNVSYTVYFYCQLDKPLKNIGIWSADIPDNMNRQGGDAVNKPEYQQLIKNAKIFRSVSEAQGKHIGFFVEFPT
ncbi:MAG: glycoside hydrolase family 92 protein, partial [Bacteroidaceae bacterium]|nr:glycoside hydrolase family 92 protein [Bacteroidaceae bacterium]